MDLKDVQLIHYNLKMGSGNKFLEIFWMFFGSVGVAFEHKWVTHPRVLRIGWAEAEKIICVRFKGCAIGS